MSTFKKFAYPLAIANAVLGSLPPFNGTSAIAWLCAGACLYMAVKSK